MTDPIEKVREAAQAVIDRWETPKWKDAEPTAAVIARLREALSLLPAAVEPVRCIDMCVCGSGYKCRAPVHLCRTRSPSLTDEEREAICLFDSPRIGDSFREVQLYEAGKRLARALSRVTGKGESDA